MFFTKSSILDFWQGSEYASAARKYLGKILGAVFCKILLFKVNAFRNRKIMMVLLPGDSTFSFYTKLLAYWILDSKMQDFGDLKPTQRKINKNSCTAANLCDNEAIYFTLFNLWFYSFKSF